MPILIHQGFLISRIVNHFINRVLVIIPTRELAMQCYEMFQILNRYTKLSCVLLIGAVPLEKQKSELNRNPLLIIATPGRLIDHLQNSQVIKNFGNYS